MAPVQMARATCTVGWAHRLISRSKALKFPITVPTRFHSQFCYSTCIFNARLRKFHPNPVHLSLTETKSETPFLPRFVQLRFTHSQNKKDLYTILNISPYATQAQIKQAYYKLSMKYHPDHNKGSETAHTRFQEITEAYSVLGQYDKRRKYDKGLLHGYTPPPAHVYARKFHKSTPTQTDVTGNKAVYNFDEFYRAHYGEALKREQQARMKRATKIKEEGRVLHDIHQQLMIAFVTVLVLVIGWYAYTSKTAKRKSDVHV